LPQKETSSISSVPLEQTQPTQVDLIPEEPIIHSNQEIPEEQPSGFSLWIHEFFSDRPLAKIGGILIFLSALFFLWLIFDAVGPVWKVTLWLLFWFFLIGVGAYLDSRDISTEARVVIGVWIAINYLTILSGRYLLIASFTGGNSPLFSDIFATFALLLNSALAVILALVYRSRALLGFAFIFAYLTPFLVNAKTSSVPLFTIYTTLITLSISIILSFLSRKGKSENLLFLQVIGILGMTTLFGLAVLDIDWAELLILYAWLLTSAIGLGWYFYKNRISPMGLLSWVYAVLTLSAFAENGFLALIFATLACTLFVLFFVLQGLLFFPWLLLFSGISFLLWLIGFWMDGSHAFGYLLLFGSSIFVLLSFLIIRLSSVMLSVFSVFAFGLFLILWAGSIGYHAEDMPSILSLRIIALLVLLGSSIFASRLRTGIVFFLWIIMSGILLIYPDTTEMLPFFSIVSGGIYLALSLIAPYILTQKEQKIEHYGFLLGSLPISAIVITYSIYQFLHVGASGMTLGFAYIVLAWLYLAYGYISASRFYPMQSTSTSELHQDQKQLILILFALPLSLFTFALAFVFGDKPGIMSLAWILEATILYGVYMKMNNIRISIFAHIVLTIGIMKEVLFSMSLMEKDWYGFGILAIMLASLISGVVLFRKNNEASRTPYDILHIFWILGIGIGMAEIFPSTGTGWSLLGSTIVLLILQVTYTQYGKTIHRIFLAILLAFLSLFFIERFTGLKKDDLLPLFVQFSSLALIYVVGHIGNTSRKSIGGVSFAISLLAILIISSFYVEHFAGTFVLSLYLTLIASVLIILGINTTTPKYRTIGLYIGSFALFKILCYDIWANNYDAIFRVVALMVAGGTMIYLSQLYARYVARSWSEEFSLENVFSELHIDPVVDDVQKPVSDTSESNPFSPELAQEMQHISVDHLSGVRFVCTGWTEFLIKRASVIRLALHITRVLGKTVFASDELRWAYQYTLKHLKSSMPQKDLEALLIKINQWIHEGGTVEFIQK
jgi:Predicted membrane protein (DUF2339)